MSYRRQRGVALLVVLWACTLLAILVGGYAALARVEGQQARYTNGAGRARYLAEAGVMQAIHDVWLARRADADPPEPGTRWIGDGRPYPFQLDRATITVTVEDELGKVDLNAADVPVLQSLFTAAGADPGRARRLAGEVDLWRHTASSPDPDALQRYREMGRAYGPRQARFPNIEELQAVLGMDALLYARVETAVTLWSGRAQPEPYFASPLVLAALPGVDGPTAQAYVSHRDGSPDGAGLPAMLGATPAGWARGGNVVTIVSTARDDTGVSATLRVTVRFDQLLLARDPRVPLYTILRWKDVLPG